MQVESRALIRDSFLLLVKKLRAVAVVIIINCATIGLQASAEGNDVERYAVIENIFLVIFLFEIVIRSLPGFSAGCAGDTVLKRASPGSEEGEIGICQNILRVFGCIGTDFCM